MNQMEYVYSGNTSSMGTSQVEGQNCAVKRVTETCTVTLGPGEEYTDIVLGKESRDPYIKYAIEHGVVPQWFAAARNSPSRKVATFRRSVLVYTSTRPVRKNYVVADDEGHPLLDSNGQRILRTVVSQHEMIVTVAASKYDYETASWD